MPPGHADTNGEHRPTVDIAHKLGKKARTKIDEVDLGESERSNIRNAISELEDALEAMEPVPGRDKISWYEAVSEEVFEKYQILEGLLEEVGFDIEIEPKENFRS